MPNPQQSTLRPVRRSRSRGALLASLIVLMGVVLLCLPQKSTTAASVDQGPAPPEWGSTRVALANNPAANEWMLPSTVNRRFQQAVAAGANYVYLSPKWDELETSPGHYRFKDVDFAVGQAEKANLPIVLHLRVIDTGRTTVPSDLSRAPLDSPEVESRAAALIAALAPHLRGRTAFCLFGNEVDGYFKSHPEDMAPYSHLFTFLRDTSQRQFPGAAVSFSVTFDGVPMLSASLRTIATESQFMAVTYYPLYPDFTVKKPSIVRPDLQSLMKAAGRQRILLQEVGYPSSAVNKSSEAMQAEFVGNVLTTIAGARDRFLGVNFLFMCDFSDSVTRSLASSYKLPNVDQFKAFLQTLGLFDGKGQPKPSWFVFQHDAPLLAHP